MSDAAAVWREESAFVSLTEATASAAGVEFFRVLVKELAGALDASYAFVAEFAGSTDRVRTVAFWGRGEWLEDIEYDLEGTPCADVVDGELCFYSDNVTQLFPTDNDLAEIGARSYLGVPLLNPDGIAVGHLAVFDTRPMPESPRGLSIFRVFANRARVELERLRAEAALTRARRKLEFQVERQSRDLELAYRELEALLHINRAVAGHLRRDDLFRTVGKVVQQVLPAERVVVFLPRDTEFSIYALFPGGDTQLFRGESLEQDRTMAGWAFKERQIFKARSPDELGERFSETRAKLLQEGMRSVCAAPLLSGESCLGAVGFMAPEAGAYDAVPDTLIEQLAAAVAVALDNCLAYEQLSALHEQIRAENIYLQEEIQSEHNFRELVGSSPALLEVLAQIERVAPTHSTVLILGETGTGKELIARAIHNSSQRQDRPLVKVNCSAISAGLVESELFGHVKGAFTGATSARVGRFELADGGTLFLDEIGELPLDTQVKLLRVLQEREFEPVGSSKPKRVDVRVLAATNRDLAAAVEQGKFRSDLYYRLNVLPLVVPPLRERRDDIPLLVEHFLERYSKEIGKQFRGVDRATMKRLCAYDWPGNVRELQNIVERAVVLAGEPVLTIDEPLDRGPRRPATSRPAESSGMLPLEEIERRHIAAALERCDGVIAGDRGAAKVLGMHPNTLRSRIEKLGVPRP